MLNIVSVAEITTQNPTYKSKIFVVDLKNWFC